MQASDIYLIRHGIREDFVDPSWKLTASEPGDTPLSEGGLRQACDIAGALTNSGIRAVYCSPFTRALQTAAPLSEHLVVPVFIEPGFGEWLSPEWFAAPPSLLPAHAAGRICPLTDPTYLPAHQTRGLEGDESVEVRARVKKTIETILARRPGESFAVVLHGSPLCQAAGLLLGTLDGIDTGMGAITHISFKSGIFALISSGSTHLRDNDHHLRFH